MNSLVACCFARGAVNLILDLPLFMDTLSIIKAHSRLNIARGALDSIKKCNEFGRITEYWYTFLFSANGIYTVLEKGAKISPQSRQWFGSKKNDRRRDQLLQYLAQARDDDEHGLNHVIKHDTTISQVMVQLGDGSRQLLQLKAQYDSGEEGVIEITSFNGQPIDAKDKFPFIRLVRVYDRGGKPYDPPSFHAGISIQDGDQPVFVASLALSYLETLVEEASKLS